MHLCFGAGDNGEIQECFSVILNAKKRAHIE